jgi:hypothetical protein
VNATIKIKEGRRALYYDMDLTLLWEAVVQSTDVATANDSTTWHRTRGVLRLYNIGQDTEYCPVRHTRAASTCSSLCLLQTVVHVTHRYALMAEAKPGLFTMFRERSLSHMPSVSGVGCFMLRMACTLVRCAISAFSGADGRWGSRVSRHIRARLSRP